LEPCSLAMLSKLDSKRPILAGNREAEMNSGFKLTLPKKGLSGTPRWALL